MSTAFLRKILIVAAGFLAGWLGIRYLLPVLLPFVLGAGLALAAEPMVLVTEKRLHFPRVAASGIGVGVTLLLLAGLLSFLGALAVKELGRLADTVPDIAVTATQGIHLLQDWLVGITERAPETVRPMLTGTVLNFFSDGTAVMESVGRKLPGVITDILTRVPDRALGLGTGILAGFMISARLPRIRTICRTKLAPAWQEKYLPAMRRIRHCLGGWLRAQIKLMLVSFAIVTVALLILAIPNSLLWGFLVALVDAVPLLGTGTVLLPWALISFLQGQPFRAVGLLCTYIIAMLVRTVLEPRLIGKQLGIDPLLTLLVMYLGYCFWGILGMFFAPILATAVKSVIPFQKGEIQENQDLGQSA